MPRIVFFAALLAAAFAVVPCRAQPPESTFAAGYAAAVLDEQGVGGATVTVRGAEVLVWSAGLSVPDKESVARSLRRLPGIESVRFPPDPAAYPLGDYGPGRFPGVVLSTASHAATTLVPPPGLLLFPRRPLFAPLLADPREPHASGSLLAYRPGAELHRVWAAGFGANLPMVGGDLGSGGQWQFGVQGDVFTLWNLDTVSDDHVNADFFVGLPVTWRWDKLSAMARLYHISSHLGDEFLLSHPRVARVNMAYEAVDVKISYDLGAVRVYGGGGRMIRRDPETVGRGALQAGAEYTHSRAYVRGLLRPVVALDLQKHEKSGWGATDVSARAGFQLEHRARAERRALLLLEYYNGKDPNGQFFTRTISYAGLGLHVFF